jgi:hypothetical protein
LISFAGPAAGFALAGVVIAAVYAAGGKVDVWWFANVMPVLSSEGFANPYLRHLVDDLLYVNIFWGLVNLLPVFPLDGGQIARELFLLGDPWNGFVRSLWLSVFTAGLVAVLGGVLLRDLFIALFFGSLAFASYQMLQQITRGGGFGGGGFGGRLSSAPLRCAARDSSPRGVALTRTRAKERKKFCGKPVALFLLIATTYTHGVNHALCLERIVRNAARPNTPELREVVVVFAAWSFAEMLNAVDRRRKDFWAADPV